MYTSIAHSNGFAAQGLVSQRNSCQKRQVGFFAGCEPSSLTKVSQDDHLFNTNYKLGSKTTDILYKDNSMASSSADLYL